jgi:hypothetical protein
MFSLPVLLGGFVLFVGGVMYLGAAIRGEKSLTKEQIMKGGQV